MIQYYAPDIRTTLTLPPEESGHCVKVLRSRAGDTVWVVDGQGHRYRCVLTEPDRQHARVEIAEELTVTNPWGAELIAAVAPTKNIDRMEWMVEKLVEMGVDRIIPLLCRHSERRTLKGERLERIAVSAMKQSLKATLPVIEPLTDLPEALQLISSRVEAPGRFMAHCEADQPRVLLAQAVRPDTTAAFLIGPEGDFDPEEISAAAEAGFRAVSLGDCRLRTETAAIAAAQTIHTIRQLHNLTQ